MNNYATLLHLATQRNDIEWIRELLVRGACVNIMDSRGKTPLHYAIDLDQYDVIKLLLKTNADINMMGKDQFSSPLHYSVKNNRPVAVKLLLEAGARIDIEDKISSRLTQFSFTSRGTDYLQSLLNAELANPRRHRLLHPATHLAAILGFYDLYWLMFNEYNISINLRDETFSTVLHYVVKRGDVEEVKRLIINGADVNLLDNRSWNVLQYAIQFGFTSLVLYLVENGAVENKQCLPEHEPLCMAAFCRHTEILRILISIYDSINPHLLWNMVLRSSIVNGDMNNMICALDMGARLDSSSTQLELSMMKPGLPTWHLALQKLTIEELNILFRKSHVNINVTDGNGWTPLHFCARYNRSDLLSFLVDQCHADLNALTNANEDALMLALLHGHIDLAEKLLRKGLKADFNRVYHDDKTLLEYAIAQKAASFVKLFLKMGANPDFSADNDMFPLRLAIQTGSVEIIECLINSGVDTNRTFKVVERDKGPYKQINDALRVRHYEWKILSYVAFMCRSNIMRYLIEEYKLLDVSWKTDISIIDAFAKGVPMSSFGDTVDTIETYDVLLRNGYDLHIQEELTGKYPIHIICDMITSCAINTELSIILILKLIDFKANINAKDSFHRTPLHILASHTNNHRHLYRILVKFGAQKYLVDSDGHLATDIASVHAANEQISLCSIDKVRSKSKFYFLSAKLRLQRRDLVDLLNNNVQIRKLLPYSTKNLQQIELSDDEDISKQLKRINDKYLLSEYLFDWILKRAVQFKTTSEESEIRNTIQKLLNDLLTAMTHIDERFCDSRLIPSGSGFEGFKMDKPDEFDFLYEFGTNDFIAESTTHFVPTNDPCYVKIAVDDIEIQSKWKDFIDNKENLLNASKLRLYIVLLMQQASFTNAFRSKWWQHDCLQFNLVPYHKNALNCGTLINQSKVGALLQVEWNGKKYQKLSISIDIAPAIPVSHQWPSGANKHSLPVIDLDDITQWGYHLVTKADYNLCDMFAWRISFSLCEYQMFSRLNLCQSACFTILKLLRMPFEDVLTSWMWKSVFFQHLQKTMKNDWDMQRLSEHVSACLSYMWPNELTVEPNPVHSFFIQHQIIDPTDATRSYNVKNIFLGLNYVKFIQKQLLRILKSS
ncbi:unnamed protein product [Rotaria magnacalcarata]|nr:unnamed protein product [Rotaria magnacalcarata]